LKQRKIIWIALVLFAALAAFFLYSGRLSWPPRDDRVGSVAPATDSSPVRSAPPTSPPATAPARDPAKRVARPAKSRKTARSEDRCLFSPRSCWMFERRARGLLPLDVASLILPAAGAPRNLAGACRTHSIEISGDSAPQEQSTAKPGKEKPGGEGGTAGKEKPGSEGGTAGMTGATPSKRSRNTASTKLSSGATRSAPGGKTTATGNPGATGSAKGGGTTSGGKAGATEGKEPAARPGSPNKAAGNANKSNPLRVADSGKPGHQGGTADFETAGTEGGTPGKSTGSVSGVKSTTQSDNNKPAPR